MAATQQFVTGYLGQDSPVYVVAPLGQNEVLMSVQEWNDTEEAPLADVMQQGYPTVKHLRGIANTTGDGVLTAMDVYQMNVLAGQTGQPNVARIGDFDPVDVIHLFIDQDTRKLTYGRFSRKVKLRSRGSRTGVGGAAHTIPVAFSAEETIEFQGAPYVDNGSLGAGTFTCRKTPVLTGGLLRLSVMVNGSITDITARQGTDGSSSNPSYTYVASTGVVTLYGVSSGSYTCVYLIAVPDVYAITDDKNNPALVLPS